MAESSRDEIAKLEAMYAANPEGRVFTHLAEAYRKSGDLQRAREVLDDGLRRHQDSASGYVVLGRVLQDSGDAHQASDAFGRVLELDAENRVALRALGELSRSAGEPKQALTYFQQLHALDPSDDLEDVIAQLRAEIPPPPPEPAALVPEPVLPYSTPQAPPQFTPADFPQDLTSLDLGGFTGMIEPPPQEAAPEAEPAATLSGESAGASGEEQPASFESQAAPSFSRMPSLEDYGIPGADVPTDTPRVEGLETVEPMEVAPLEGLEPSDEEAGVPSYEMPAAPYEPPAAPYEPSAPQYEAPAPPEPFVGLSEGYDFGAADEEAPQFGEPASAEMVTETMAELYRSQGHLVQAAEVYRALLRDRPGDEQLERKLLEVELAILSPEPPGAPVDESGEEAWLEEPMAPSAGAPFSAEGLAALPGEAPAGAESWGAEQAPAEHPAAAEESGAEPVAEQWSAAAPQQEWTPPEEAAPQAEWTAETAQQEWAVAEPAAEANAELAPEVAEPVAGEAVPEVAEPLAAEAAPEQAEQPAWEAPVAEVAEAAVPATEQVWLNGGQVATSDATPYAWEAGAVEEAVGPPVAGYLGSLLAWRRSTSGAPEIAAEAQAEPTTETVAEAQPEASQEPAAWSDPWAEAPAAPPAEPTWADEVAAPVEPTWADEAAAPPEPTWADEAAAPPEPWAEEAPAAAVEPSPETPPAAPVDDMAWLTGPDGVAPEQSEGAQAPPEAPGDDDDLEMFRAWLQSLKK